MTTVNTGLELMSGRHHNSEVRLRFRPEQNSRQARAFRDSGENGDSSAERPSRTFAAQTASGGHAPLQAVKPADDGGIFRSTDYLR